MHTNMLNYVRSHTAVMLTAFKMSEKTESKIDMAILLAWMTKELTKLNLKLTLNPAAWKESLELIRTCYRQKSLDPYLVFMRQGQEIGIEPTKAAYERG